VEDIPVLLRVLILMLMVVAAVLLGQMEMALMVVTLMELLPVQAVAVVAQMAGVLEQMHQQPY